VAIAIFNAVVREKAYGKFMGELHAHQLSTFIGIVLLWIYIWILTGTCPIISSTQALIIGGMWLIMTILFELGAALLRRPTEQLEVVHSTPHRSNFAT
jgi:putative flippase GtrA